MVVALVVNDSRGICCNTDYSLPLPLLLLLLLLQGVQW
jgi:hypothetical protein